MTAKNTHRFGGQRSYQVENDIHLPAVGATHQSLEVKGETRPTARRIQGSFKVDSNTKGLVMEVGKMSRRLTTSRCCAEFHMKMTTR